MDAGTAIGIVGLCITTVEIAKDLIDRIIDIKRFEKEARELKTNICTIEEVLRKLDKVSQRQQKSRNEYRVTVEELQKCVNEIQDFLRGLDRKSSCGRFMKSSSIKRKFDSFNKRLRLGDSLLNTELQVETLDAVRSVEEELHVRKGTVDVDAVQQPNEWEQTSENSKGTPTRESARTNATVDNLEQKPKARRKSKEEEGACGGGEFFDNDLPPIGIPTDEDKILKIACPVYVAESDPAVGQTDDGFDEDMASDRSSTLAPLSKKEFYDIYLVASSKNTQYFRKMMDIIQNNGWKVQTPFDARLGEPVLESMEKAMLNCSHVVFIITKEDCDRKDPSYTLMCEMAFQSLTDKGLGGRIIPIVCCDLSFIPPKFRSLTSANIDDDDLEIRLKDSIDVSIRAAREEDRRSVSDENTLISMASTSRSTEGFCEGDDCGASKNLATEEKHQCKGHTSKVSGVKRKKGAGRDGYDGEWRLIDAINVTDEITMPHLVGCIDEFNFIIADILTFSTHLYTLEMNIEDTEIVKTSFDKPCCIKSCALLNDGMVVCGKLRNGCTGDSLTGCISVYDRKWNLIKDITIPRNTTGAVTRVDVAAYQDGMIIAAEAGQAKIYVINPADGNIMNTITCKQNIMMRGVLSSGHIIAQPTPLDQRVFIIDREGAQREITHSDVILNVCIDPMTDDLYVVTSDGEYKTCVIDQVMSEGDMKKRRVASFPISTRLTTENDRGNLLAASHVLMTSSGNMIASDGDNILIFKQMFSL